MCIGGKHLHNTFKPMTNTELTLDQLHQINGGLLSAGEVFDFWVDYFLGDTIDDITSNARKADKVYKEASNGVQADENGKPCTDRNLPF
jgi:hypothetical protein